MRQSRCEFWYSCVATKNIYQTRFKNKLDFISFIKLDLLDTKIEKYQFLIIHNDASKFYALKAGHLSFIAVEKFDIHYTKRPQL